jgi:hypothetical protein
MGFTASSIKGVKPARKRRTRSEISALCDAIYAVVSQQRPMTVRQVFYQLVKAGLIDKSERDYQKGRRATAHETPRRR